MRTLNSRVRVQMRRRAAGQVTGAALLAVGLIIGAGVVLATSYAYGGLAPKTLTSTSTVVDTTTTTQPVTVTSVQSLAQTSTQSFTTTSTQTVTSTSVQTQSVTQTR